MAGDSFIRLPVDGNGKLLDTSEVTVGANTVQRERTVIADPTQAANLAGVTAGGALKVDGSASTQPVSGPLTDTQLRASAVPVSAEALPLPSGASTGAKQDTGNTSLASIDGKITAVNTGAVVVSSSVLPTGAAIGTKQDTGNTSLASIDGKITAVNTGAVVVSSSALPSGASTGTKQDTGNTSLASIDGKIIAVNTGAVVVSTSALPSGASTGTKQDTGNTSLSSIDGKITAVNTGAVVVSSSALPSGAATGSKQDTGNTSLANLDVLLSTRTKPADQQHAIVDSGTLTAVTAITNALPAGTNAIGKLAANDGVDIGDVSVNNAAGASAVNIQDGGNSITVDGTVSITAASLPLPSNAAQETSGNLAALVTNTRNDPQVIDLLVQILAQLKLLNFGLASSSSTQYIDDLDTPFTLSSPFNLLS